MAHPLVEQLGIAALHDSLEALPREIKITRVESRDDDAEAEADRIHELLLRKKRSGSLGLGD